MAMGHSGGILAHVTTNGSENRFSTSLVPPAARIGFWNDISSRLFGSIHVDSRSHAPFQGEIVRIPLRDCELLSVKSSPASLTRPSATCREERSGDMLA